MVLTFQQTDIKNGRRSSQSLKRNALTRQFLVLANHSLPLFSRVLCGPICIDQVSQKGDQTVEDLACTQFQVKLVLLQASQNFLYMFQMQLRVLAVN